MTFVKTNTKNNARSRLKFGITAGQTSLQVEDGEGALFPTTNFRLTLTKFNSSGLFIKKEVMLIATRTGDIFNGVTRAYEACVQDETQNPKTETQVALSFDALDYVEICLTAGNDKDIKDEVARLETDKANDNVVVKLTGDQTVAGVKTFSSSPIIPTPTTGLQATTKDYVDSSIITATAIDHLTDATFINGEDVTAGDCLFVEQGPTFAEATSQQNIGDVTGNTRTSFVAFGSGVASNTLKLSLAKVLSPSVNLNIRIETDNAGSPSGTLIDANATATIAPGSLTTSLADTTLTLTGTITIPEGAKCHIVAYQGTYGAETVNGTNYYKIGYSTNNTTTRLFNKYAGTEWVKDYLTNLTYANKSKSISAQTANTKGITFGDSGTKMYICGGNVLYQYGLSTAYDVSTATYTKSFTVGTYTGGAFQSGVVFKTDGTKIYLSDYSANKKVYQLSLTTPRDIASIQNDTTSYTFTVSGSGCFDLAIKDDGSKIYVTDGSVIYQYSMGTPWTITTCSSDSKTLDFSSLGTTGYFEMFSDGKKLLVVCDSNDTIFQYNLGVAWDISTYSYNSLSKVITQDTTQKGIYIGEDNKIYINGDANDTVYQYSISTIVGLYGFFIYTSSTLFTDKLLSKTDADYSYKSNLYGITTETKTAGNKPKVVKPVKGSILSTVSGHPGTIGTDLFLSGTPGAVSATPGTNKYKVGTTITATATEIDNKNLLSASITVGASPYTYQNTSGFPQKVMVNGGTVSAVDYSRNGSNFYTQASATNTEIILQPTDYCKVTYSSAPTMVSFNI